MPKARIDEGVIESIVDWKLVHDINDKHIEVMIRQVIETIVDWKLILYRSQRN